ncbi:FKBP-like protein [Chaetoceros tenuissimus]|uniref:peptidylprolyl isomerase n=1 Tax=Chaetoceros tenuissimus TaxID=426638 RepID=A0AAD3H7A3_9STRA|nr:FKBP-like protein [Chaetoceros tenuissimus]
MTLLATLSSAAAFTSRTLPKLAAKSITARAMGSGPFPYDDEKMPFYALGVNLAKQVGGQTGFKSLLEDDELEMVLKGFGEEIQGSSTSDAETVLMTFGPTLNKILQERSSGLVDRIKEEGEEFINGFLDCNDDAVKTESGMVYYSMKEGDGASPDVSNTVEVHYHGTLIDGTVFDSSVERGQTISFPLGGVIKGWQEGLAMMKEGGKATLIIPSDLAYGDAGSGDTIPPGATLKFEVELFKVN